jgi:hypothetical protein
MYIEIMGLDWHEPPLWSQRLASCLPWQESSDTQLPSLLYPLILLGAVFFVLKWCVSRKAGAKEQKRNGVIERAKKVRMRTEEERIRAEQEIVNEELEQRQKDGRAKHERGRSKLEAITKRELAKKEQRGQGQQAQREKREQARREAQAEKEERKEQEKRKREERTKLEVVKRREREEKERRVRAQASEKELKTKDEKDRRQREREVRVKKEKPVKADEDSIATTTTTTTITSAPVQLSAGFTPPHEAAPPPSFSIVQPFVDVAPPSYAAAIAEVEGVESFSPPHAPGSPSLTQVATCTTQQLKLGLTP